MQLLRFPGQLVLTDDGRSNLTLFYEGEHYEADDTHPAWDRIIEGAFNGDPSVFDLFDVGYSVGKRFLLSGRVSYAKGYLFFDDDVVTDGLANHVVRMLSEDPDADVGPWIALLENISQNPSDNSREQLFGYINEHNITITREGELVLYKYVYRNHNHSGHADDVDDPKPYRSGHGGPALVNGEPHLEGCVPQDIGDVITMPRSEVVDDRENACASGLHCGAWHYVSGTADVHLEIHVHPRDVVSVPTDDPKVRVCRYKIVGEVTQNYEEPVLAEVEPEREPESVPYSEPQGVFLGTNVVTHPSKKEFEIARLKARAQRKGFVAYATTRLKWRQVAPDADANNRMHWSKV